MSKIKRKHLPEPLFPFLFKPLYSGDDILRRLAATADSSREAERHVQALRQVLREQNGYLFNEQAYYPGDAVELAAYRSEAVAPYLLAHLLMIQSEAAQTCRFMLAPYYRHYQAARNSLPPSAQQTLDAAYRLAVGLGLIDCDW